MIKSNLNLSDLTITNFIKVHSKEHWTLYWRLTKDKLRTKLADYGAYAQCEFWKAIEYLLHVCERLADNSVTITNIKDFFNFKKLGQPVLEVRTVYCLRRTSNGSSTAKTTVISRFVTTKPLSQCTDCRMFGWAASCTSFECLRTIRSSICITRLSIIFGSFSDKQNKTDFSAKTTMRGWDLYRLFFNQNRDKAQLQLPQLLQLKKIPLKIFRCFS